MNSPWGFPKWQAPQCILNEINLQKRKNVICTFPLPSTATGKVGDGTRQNILVPLRPWAQGWPLPAQPRPSSLSGKGGGSHLPAGTLMFATTPRKLGETD